MKGNAMSTQVAEPYAEALMALAQDNGKVDLFGENSRSLLKAMAESDELRAFIANPLLKAEEKKAVITDLCGSDTDTAFLNFLLLLVDRRRIVFLEGICERFIALERTLKNIVLAEVTCASVLNEPQEQAIAQQVKAMTGASNVELNVTTDASLIGGAIIKVGSQVFDASLKGQLRRIGMSLLGSN